MLNHNAMWALMSWDVVMMNCWHSSWLFSFPLLPLPLCAFYTRILRQAHGITIAIQLESPTATQPWKLAPLPPVCTRWLSVRPPGPPARQPAAAATTVDFRRHPPQLSALTAALMLQPMSKTAVPSVRKSVCYAPDCAARQDDARQEETCRIIA